MNSVVDGLILVLWFEKGGLGFLGLFHRYSRMSGLLCIYTVLGIYLIQPDCWDISGAAGLLTRINDPWLIALSKTTRPEFLGSTHGMSCINPEV